MEDSFQTLAGQLDRIETLLYRMLCVCNSNPSLASVGSSTPQGAPLSLKEAATYQQLSRSHLYTLVHAGTIQPLQRYNRNGAK